MAACSPVKGVVNNLCRFESYLHSAMNRIETIKIGRHWYVREEKTGLEFDRYRWKYQAVPAGRTLAKYLKREHVIKDKHGVIRNPNSYGPDSPRNKG